MAICMGLSDEMMVASNLCSYGSIRETFAHILKAEISFLKRIHGIYPEPDFRWEDNPGLSQMAAYEATLNNALLDTLQNVPATQNVHEAGWLDIRLSSPVDIYVRGLSWHCPSNWISRQYSIIKASIYQSWMSGVIVPHTLSDFNPDYQKSGDIPFCLSGVRPRVDFL